MKPYYLLVLLFLTIAPRASFGQTEEQLKQFQGILELSQNDQSGKALHLIDSLKKTVNKKDTMYMMLVMASSEITLTNNDCERGIADCEELMQLVPEVEKDVQMNIARLKKIMGDLDGSIKAYKRILEIAPNDEIVYSNYAGLLNLKGQHREAINILNSNPNGMTDSLGYFHYAIAYYKLGSYDSARININRFLKMEWGAKDYLSYYYAALIYQAQGDKKQACEQITRANKLLVSENVNAAIAKDYPKKYWYYTIAKKEIEDVKSLKNKLCK